jgi:hypothetical protein
MVKDNKIQIQRFSFKNKKQKVEFICPCGGGQSCIVDRRRNNDWVHEDDVFKAYNLPLRKNCFQKYYDSQYKVLFPN